MAFDKEQRFLEHVLRNLVDDADAVRVSVAEEGPHVVATLEVEGGEYGKIIGRRGRILHALRQLMPILSRTHGHRFQLRLADRAEEFRS